MTPPADHPALSSFPVVNGVLSVGGMSLDALAKRVGKTPFYVYDRAKMTERVNLLRRHFPSEVKLHYAVKANPLPDVVTHLAGLVDGADVASGGELVVAKNAGFSAEDTSFAGPGKRSEELAQAVQWGALINLESAREVDILSRVADELGRAPRVAVRVNPDFGLKHSGVKMGGGPQPFGVDAEQVPALLTEIGRRGLAFEGFHIFSGSQNLQSGAIVESQNLTLELAIRLAASAPRPVRVVNIGGGFGIPYFPGTVLWTSLPSVKTSIVGWGPCAPPFPKLGSRWSWGDTWWGRRDCLCAEFSIGRCPAGKRFWWWTAGCTTTSPRPAILAR